jgi:acetate kinase
VDFDCTGHRFVHGGSLFSGSTWITDDNLDSIQACLPLAPIHNPNSFSVFRVCREYYPQIPQYLTFDTAFHAGLQPSAYTYALSTKIQDRFHFRKYGFHGLSYQYVSRAAAGFLSRPVEDLKMIACHLGTGGSSVAAIRNGMSVDTSMGYTPLAGLMMSTRSGDLDASVILDILENGPYDSGSLNDLFNKKSGLLGVSGISSDIRDIQEAMSTDEDASAKLAYDLYCYRLQKQIGAYIMLLEGADVLIFTDDIGSQNSQVRRSACQGMEWSRILLDEEKNNSVKPGQINAIHQGGGKTVILAMPTDEESVIAGEGVRLWAGGSNVRH